MMIYLFTEKYNDKIEHYFYNSSDKFAYSVEIVLESGFEYHYYRYDLEKIEVNGYDDFDYVIPTILKIYSKIEGDGIIETMENEILNIILSGI